MTREDLKRQVLARVNVPVGFFALGDTILSRWLDAYPAKFVFGPAEVMSAERQLRRELNYAQRKAANALRGADPQ